jgi:hypothetical protein
MGYNALMFPEFHIGDVVKMRKAHPCGGFDWKIYRLGADIGLECLTCQHRVFLSRRELAHKLKTLTPVSPVDEVPPTPQNSDEQ